MTTRVLRCPISQFLPCAVQPSSLALHPLLRRRQHRSTAHNHVLCSQKNIDCQLPMLTSVTSCYPQFLSRVLETSNCVATTDLLVSKGRLAWCLYIDLVALDHSGNIWDAALAAMLAALETVSLPSVSVDPDTGEISVDPTSCNALPLHCRPVSSTSCLFPPSQSGAEASLLADPTCEEEQLASASLSVVCVQETGEVCHLRQPGGAPVSQVALQTCIAAAQQHAKTLAKAVHKVTK